MRACAAGILGRISPEAAALPEAIRVLKRLLHDPSARVRATAAAALGNLGQAAADTLLRVVASIANDPDDRCAIE